MLAEKMSSLACDLVSSLAIKTLRAFTTAIFSCGIETASPPLAAAAAAALDSGTNNLLSSSSANFSTPHH
jgi:hypothetical protein